MGKHVKFAKRSHKSQDNIVILHTYYALIYAIIYALKYMH